MGTQARVDATMLASGGTRNALFPRSIATVGALMSLVSSVLISAMLYTYQVRVDCVIVHLAGEFWW